ncbi:hypothetical protein VCHENC02_1131B, partial [Vibrio harveyi]
AISSILSYASASALEVKVIFSSPLRSTTYLTITAMVGPLT